LAVIFGGGDRPISITTSTVYARRDSPLNDSCDESEAQAGRSSSLLAYAPVMRKLTGSIVLLVVVAACGGSTTASTISTPASVATTQAAAVTTATAVPVPTSTTAPDSTTIPPSPPGAQFVITQVSLGVLGKVVIQNVGTEAASLDGYWLCQRPSYYQFPDVVLQPGESAAISVGGDIFVPPEGAIVIDEIAAIGPFDPESGEVGLYLGSDFSSPEAIVSYVEWGSSGHGRSDVAVSAQIWPEGGFVPTTADSGAILATRIPATDPSHWTGG